MVCCSRLQLAAPIGRSPFAALALDPFPPLAVVPIGLSPPCVWGGVGVGGLDALLAAHPPLLGPSVLNGNDDLSGATTHEGAFGCFAPPPPPNTHTLPQCLTQQRFLCEGPCACALFCGYLRHEGGTSPAPYTLRNLGQTFHFLYTKITSQRFLDQSQAVVCGGKRHKPPHFGPFWGYSRTLPQGVELLV